MELLEDAGLMFFGDTRPSVRYGDGEVAILGRDAHAHFSYVGELDCVADEVEQHLGKPLFVAEPHGHGFGYFGLERKLLVLRQRLGRGAHRLDDDLDRILRHVQGELFGFDLSDIKHRVDEPKEVLAVGAYAPPPPRIAVHFLWRSVLDWRRSSLMRTSADFERRHALCRFSIWRAHNPLAWRRQPHEWRSHA